MIEDRKLKLFLIIQSFSPLFLLLLLKHGGLLITIFFRRKDVFDFCIGEHVGNIIITCISIIWLVFLVVVVIGFRSYQTGNFSSKGEHIIILSEKKDSGALFLVTFILPLLVDDLNGVSDILFFVMLLIIVIILLTRSDLFYQNPVLTFFKYKVFEFRFENPIENSFASKTYIGISKNELPDETKAIKRKYIAGDVFFFFFE